MRKLVVSVFLVAATVLPSPVTAKFCGDDVGGVRVACDCGDVVASDTTLQPSDPVVSHRCDGPGLIVRASALAESLRLDLSGLALVGSSSDVGLMIDRGGADGAVVVGGPPGRPGEIVGFATGVVAPNSAALRSLERVTVKGSRLDGFIIRQSGAYVAETVAADNGRYGIRFLGTGGRLVGARSERNAGTGVFVASRGAIVEAESYDNGTHGVVSTAPLTDLRRVRARNNGAAGVIARGGRELLDGVESSGNGRGELRSVQLGVGR